MMDNSFSIDVAAIRDRARQKMDRGAVTEDYGADPAKVVEILNDIRWLGDTDVTTRRLIEDILAEEEEHADNILDLLGR